MIDSIYHTHTTWTSLDLSSSVKILYFRCKILRERIVWSYPRDHRQCEIFYDEYSNRNYFGTSCHNLDIRTAFHQCEFYDATFKFPLPLNFLSHTGQANGVSPVWILRCRFKSPFCLNFLSQSWHKNGFSPVWILRWTFKLLLLLNFLLQSGQANGFSPVWILRWTFNSLFNLNFFSQSGHVNGFSPVWVLRCEVNSEICLNFFSQFKTGERLFTSVSSTMYSQVNSLFEFLVTIRTGERLFTSMNSTMHYQVAIMFETLVTIRTNERLTIARHFLNYCNVGQDRNI